MPAPIDIHLAQSGISVNGNMISFLLPPTPGFDHVAPMMSSSSMGAVAGVEKNTPTPVNTTHTTHITHFADTDTTDTDTIDVAYTNTTTTTSTSTTTSTTASTATSTINGRSSCSTSSSSRAFPREKYRPVERRRSQRNLRRRSRGLLGDVYGDGDGQSDDGILSLRHRLRLLDNYLSDHRSESPRTHMRHWHRATSSVVQDVPRYVRSSTDGTSPTADTHMTREEFNNLPPTVQRKYFSTLERLRFAQTEEFPSNSDLASKNSSHDCSDQSSSPSSPAPDSKNGDDNTYNDPPNHTPLPQRPQLGVRFSSEPLTSAPYRRRIVNPTLDRIYSTSTEGPKIRYQSDDGQLAVKYNRQSVILDATDEAFIKNSKRQSQLLPLRPESVLERSPLDIEDFEMHPLQSHPMMERDLHTTADPLFDSFRWLDNDNDLDLRLYGEETGLKLGSDAPSRSKNRASFRRHLSISKLPFSRPSTTLSRPGTREASSPTFMSSPPVSLPGSPGHGRRRSRALSLISPNKQALPEASVTVDADATHYQDPEARMKLRVYLASAHKFDEALEFGFPSIDEVHGKEHLMPTEDKIQPRQHLSGHTNKLRVLSDDDKSSVYTDEASTAEPDTPKTPQDVETFDTMKTPVAPARHIRTSHDALPTPLKVDYAQAPASSREMTLRMTLTRPDLRAHEDTIYGWQRKISVGRKSDSQDGPVSPTAMTHGSNRKESIERQFALIDQENLLANSDSGVVKRFWNRVRRP